MPPKFKKGTSKEEQDRVTLLGIDSSDEEEEEIFLNNTPHDSRHSARRAHGDKVRQVQDQVSGVISVMRDNIERVLDRGEKLDELEMKSENLAESSSQFRVSARRLERKMWWKRCRLKLIISGVVAAILIIIIIIIIVKTRN